MMTNAETRHRLKQIALRLGKSLLLRRFPIAYARACGVTIGNGCRWMNPSSSTFGSEPYLITIGDHVSIGGGVRFITHDGGVWIFRKELPRLDVIARIRVGNNVFIGHDCMILPGVRIHDNVVLGARSVVTRDIPPNVVAAGIPARIISTVEDYRRRCIEKGVETKMMMPYEKAKFLLNNLRDPE
jgi:acetyltransferase-like isoleucine patch superfamily enzyme